VTLSAVPNGASIWFCVWGENSSAESTQSACASYTVPASATGALTSLTMSPQSVSVAPGGTQQFSASALWSDGGTTVPALTWTATGGTITTGGLYTAGSATGTFRVIAAAAGGTPADTSVVTVQSSTGGGSSSAPWLVEDFSRYSSTTDLLSSAFGVVWSVGEDEGTQYITLDASGGAPGGSGKSMKYTWPDRSNDPNICHDFTVGRNLTLPSQVQEVWIEIWAKFSSNFSTGPLSQCTGISTPAYKFVFGRVDVSSRFQVILGGYGGPNGHINFGYPDHEDANDTDFTTPPPSAYFDGQWHRWRMHFKVSAGGTNNGTAILYVDNTLVHAFTNVTIARNFIYGIALGRNLNQGPIQLQSLNWGSVRLWNVSPGWGW
jgi:hypothetical protein